MVASSDVDVLIVGAGPAGLMAAEWLSRFPEIRTRIVDKRSDKLFVGQADGLQCRTLETFASFGIAHFIEREATVVEEVNFWNPGADGKLERTSRIPDPGTSRFAHYVLHQGRIEGVLLNDIAKHSSIRVERSTQPIALSVTSDSAALANPSAHPFTVSLRKLSDAESTIKQDGAIPNGLHRSNAYAVDEAVPEADDHVETIRARYLLGADGARSWVRQQLGYRLEGDSAVRPSLPRLALIASNVYWGVIDAVPLSNFPDIRTKVAIHSASEGSILIIPREDQMVRLYVQLGRTEAGARLDRSTISVESIMATARKIIAPYTLDTGPIAWWTVYEIGQRLCPSMSAYGDRAFIIGDAAHTHSPQAGQGMNVSMMDAYNLGWKLAGVLRGELKPEILATYNVERHQIATELINFDHKFSRLFSGRPSKSLADESGISLEEFKAYWQQFGEWTSGIAVHYQASPIVANGRQSSLSNIVVGKRLPSRQVVTFSDARPRYLDELMPSDGRWRLLAFVGDIRLESQRSAMHKLAEHLDSPSSFARRYTPRGRDVDGLIDCLTVVATPRIEVDYESFPDALRPIKRPHGYRDHHKIFSDERSYHAGHGEAYSSYGIDPSVGALVMVRPDGYVSLVCAVDAFAELESFADGVFVSAL